MSKPSMFRSSTGAVPFAVRIPEAQRVSGLGRSAIFEGLNSGEIDGVKNGRITLVIVESLRRYVESLPRYDRQNPPEMIRAAIQQRKSVASQRAEKTSA
jgi:hypothetical protein